MKKRVVITGLGTVNAIGNDLETFWNNAQAGVSGTDRIKAFDPSDVSSQIAAELKGFEPTKYVDKKEARRMDPFVQYAIAAADMAINDSRVDLNAVDKTRFGVAIGSGMGGLHTLEEQHQILMEKGASRVSPFFIPMEIINLAAGHVSIRYGLQGANFALATACASGAHAVGEALRWIQRGSMDMMLAGGSEATVTKLAVAGFANMKALSTRNDDPTRASRPFDKDRDGFVMGEGAGMLVLEELEHALARNAQIYAEVIGYSTTGDGYHITSPDPDAKGVTRCMKNAVEDAGLAPQEIDYINAHGTSTPLGDVAETVAIKRALGDAVGKTVVNSTKSMTGHLLGGAGGVESVFTALAVAHQKSPPTINLDNPGEGCDLDYCANVARDLKIEVAMSNNFGFGGTNGTLVMKKI